MKKQAAFGLSKQTLRKIKYFEELSGSYMMVSGSDDDGSDLLKSMTPYVRALGFLCAAGGKEEDMALINHLVAWMRNRGADPDPLNFISNANQAYRTLGKNQGSARIKGRSEQGSGRGGRPRKSTDTTLKPKKPCGQPPKEA
jgi:hypothetical protein